MNRASSPDRPVLSIRIEKAVACVGAAARYGSLGRCITVTAWPSGTAPPWLTQDLLNVAERFARVRKQGRVLARWTPPGESRAVYLKCQGRFAWGRRFVASVWPRHLWTPALVELRNLLLAKQAGISVPEAVGAVQVIGPRARLAGVLAVRELTGLAPLHELLFAASGTLGRKEYELYLRCVLSSVGAVAARLHAANLFHRDLYLCHFFAQPGSLAWSSDESSELVLIDFHRLVHSRVLALPAAAKDLGQLLYSLREIGAPAWASDYLLERYLRRAPVSRPLRGILCTMARAKADRYWRHNVRRGTVWRPPQRSAA